MRNYSICIISSYSNSRPSAANDRINALCIGFKKNKVECDIVSLIDLSSSKLGSFSWPFVALLNYKKLFDNKDCIYVYSENFFLCLTLFFLGKKSKKRVFFDVCEWVEFACLRKHSSIFKASLSYVRNVLYRNFVVRFSDGVIAISALIERKTKNYGTRVIRVPALAIAQMDYPNNIGLKENYPRCKTANLFVIMYSGGLKPQESFWNFFEAFLLLSNVESSRLRLNLSGYFSFEEFCKLAKENLNFFDISRLKNVNFLGFLKEEDYVEEMHCADLLVLPRGNNNTAIASFPNRLPNYLATRIPVLTSNIPDLPDYLRPDYHFISANFEDIGDIRSVLLYCFNNQSEIKKVGIRGSSRARRVFDARYQTARMLRFIEQET